MRKGYMELNELNRDLVSGYHVRSTNHEELVKSLKLVNQFIQKAAHLRGKVLGFQVFNVWRKSKPLDGRRVPHVWGVWSSNPELAKSCTALQTIRHRFNIYASSCVALTRRWAAQLY